MQEQYKRIRDKIFIPSFAANLYLGHIVALLVLIAYPIIVDQFKFPLAFFTILLAIYILYCMVLPEKPNIQILITGFVAIVYTLFYLEENYDYTSIHYLIKSILLFLFAMFMFTSMLVETLHAEISLRLLYQSIDCYLFLGICFTFLFRILHFIDPHAFNFELKDEFNHIYMSFVVLTSIGLGDLLPTTLPAKALVILNGLLGQIYIAFFAAMIVGKYLTKATKSN